MRDRFIGACKQCGRKTSRKNRCARCNSALKARTPSALARQKLDGSCEARQLAADLGVSLAEARGMLE